MFRRLFAFRDLFAFRYSFAFAIILVVAVAWSSSAAAQNIGTFRQRLATPHYDGSGHAAAVEIEECGSAADAVRRADSAEKQHSINGYRVTIFFDNSHTARAEAERRMSEFMAGYPDIRCYLRYENPYFKVVVGNCATAEDAVLLLGRIRKDFPEAYIMREEIRITEMVSLPKRAPAHEKESPEDDAEGASSEA